MSSFDSINFSIRPNKNVERKLVFEALASLEPAFPYSGYQYVGLGSMWFADFVLAHRLLGIQSMTSIQSGTDDARRALFNAPYRCIEVLQGDSSVVLPDIQLERGPAVVWMDYECTPDRILDEVAQLCTRLTTGSILLVTANAHKDNVTVADESDRRKLTEDTYRTAYNQLAPAVFPKDFFDRSRYPDNIAAALLAHLTHATRVAGREERFAPLFNFRYRDNAPMITVGGMIANKVDTTRLERASVLSRFPYVRNVEQIEIDVPPLTTREKLALDKLFPASQVPPQSEVAKLGFGLKDRQIAAYHQYYGRYPVFGEMLP